MSVCRTITFESLDIGSSSVAVQREQLYVDRELRPRASTSSFVQRNYSMQNEDNSRVSTARVGSWLADLSQLVLC